MVSFLILKVNVLELTLRGTNQSVLENHLDSYGNRRFDGVNDKFCVYSICKTSSFQHPS